MGGDYSTGELPEGAMHDEIELKQQTSKSTLQAHMPLQSKIFPQLENKKNFQLEW